MNTVCVDNIPTYILRIRTENGSEFSRMIARIRSKAEKIKTFDELPTIPRIKSKA